MVAKKVKEQNKTTLTSLKRKKKSKQTMVMKRSDLSCDKFETIGASIVEVTTKDAFTDSSEVS